MKETYAKFQTWLNENYNIKNRFPLCKKYPGNYLLTVEQLYCLLKNEDVFCHCR